MDDWQEQLLEYGKYLDEIRRRLYRLAIVFGSVFFTAFCAAGYIVMLPLKLFHMPNVVIAASSPFQYVSLSVDVGFFFAFLVTMPMFVYQLYKFLRSALTQKEQKMFKRFIPLMIILFIIGFSYGMASMYVAFLEMAKLNTSIGLTNLWDVSKFFSQMVMTSTLLALLFESPIILTILIRLNFVKVSYLVKKQRYAVVLIFVFVSLLPPTDAMSITLMSLPLVALYYMTIFINRGYRPEFEPKAYQATAQINQLTKEKLYV